MCEKQFNVCLSVCVCSWILMDIFNYSIMNTMNSIKGLGSPWRQRLEERGIIRAFFFCLFIITGTSIGKFIQYGNATYL